MRSGIQQMQHNGQTHIEVHFTPRSDLVPFAGDSLERSYLFYDWPSTLSSNAPTFRGQSRLSGFCCANRLCVWSLSHHNSRMRTFDENSCAISITSPRSLYRPRTQQVWWDHREKSRRASTLWDCRGKSQQTGPNVNAGLVKVSRTSWASLWHGDWGRYVDPYDSFPHNVSLNVKSTGSAGKRTRPGVQCPNGPQFNMAIRVTSEHTYAQDRIPAVRIIRLLDTEVVWHHKPITTRYLVLPDALGLAVRWCLNIGYGPMRYPYTCTCRDQCLTHVRKRGSRTHIIFTSEWFRNCICMSPSAAEISLQNVKNLFSCWKLSWGEDNHSLK